MTFADELKKAAGPRLTYGQQPKLADEIGIDPSALSRLATGVRKPSPKTAVKLADALNLTGVKRETFLLAAVDPNLERADPLAAFLQDLVDAERMINYARPQDMEGSKDAVRTYVLAMIVELSELVQELDWKAWKDRQAPPDNERVADEFADVLAFLGVITANVMAQTGLTYKQLSQAFTDKTKTNLRRARGEIDGYIPSTGTHL